MCMLTYLPPFIQPDKDALSNGATRNNDGHGYAIVIPGKFPRLLVRHSLMRETLIDQFIKDRKRYPSGPALFHSRWGTSGIDGKFNCHPFVMGGDELTVVAHNGVLPESVAKPSSSDDRCDTRIAADDVFAQRYGDLNTEEAREALGKAIGTANKLVILTINPHYSSSAFIINEGSGNWDDSGIWYSNYDYCGYSRGIGTAASFGYGWDWDESDYYLDKPSGEYANVYYKKEDACPLCGALGAIDEPSQTCIYCEGCLDCYEDISDCNCYLPVKSASDSFTPSDEDGPSDGYEYWSESRNEYVSYQEWRKEFDAQLIATKALGSTGIAVLGSDESE